MNTKLTSQLHNAAMVYRQACEALTLARDAYRYATTALDDATSAKERAELALLTAGYLEPASEGAAA